MKNFSLTIEKIKKHKKDSTIYINKVSKKQLKLILRAAIIDSRVDKEELLYQANRNMKMPIDVALVAAFFKVVLEDFVKKNRNK